MILFFIFSKVEVSMGYLFMDELAQAVEPFLNAGGNGALLFKDPVGWKHQC